MTIYTQSSKKGSKNNMDMKDLPQTEKAFEALETVLKDFQGVLQNKKNALLQQRQSYKNNMLEKNKQIDDMKAVVAKVLDKTTKVVQTIDMVLKEDDSGNSNN